MNSIEKDRGLIKRPDREHRVLRPTQTGFTSPATHYAEPRIDLNEVLVENPNSTFFIRVIDESYKEHGIAEKDVLIVDKSIQPEPRQLACVTSEGSFGIKRIEIDSKEELQIWGTITHIIKSVL